jgi:hypothetical protein
MVDISLQLSTFLCCSLNIANAKEQFCSVFWPFILQNNSQVSRHVFFCTTLVFISKNLVLQCCFKVFACKPDMRTKVFMYCFLFNSLHQLTQNKNEFHSVLPCTLGQLCRCGWFWLHTDFDLVARLWVPLLSLCDYSPTNIDKIQKTQYTLFWPFLKA